MELLAHLAALVAVIDERGFTRAADSLGVPQPLISRRVRNLERLWGEALLDRSTRTSAPTPFASAVLPHARELLLRAERLELAVTAAREGIVRGLGVPPDGSAPALARLLTTAADHGMPLAIHELPVDARARALADGTLEYALVRVVAEAAPLRVTLGLASAPGRARPPRRWHLDALRPRRDSAAAPATLFVTPEDDVAPYLTRLRAALAVAGLPPSCVRVDAPAVAAALVLASDATLLCDEVTAGRLCLPWAPLADRALDRGYELRCSATQRRPAAVAEWMLPLLAGVIGGARPDRPGEPMAAEATDRSLRLAASG